MSSYPYARLSSTTLFNFTDSFENLRNNLLKGIYCTTIIERFPPDFKFYGYKSPMVCFCDIPLGLVKEHLDWYGNYAIGIKREEARKLGVHPVWYIHKGLPIKKIIIQKISLNDTTYRALLPYFKRFIGDQKNLNKEIHRKKFYDEHEWRYIPSDKRNLIKLLNSNPGDELKKNRCVTRMPIPLQSIEYIIVRNDKDKTNLYPFLKSLAEKNEFCYESLVSSIITAKQIRRDF
ncbi:MAG: abortive infection system antitoxin AbiGi family protein [Ignavibacteriaceae bacterium]|nr:abortive infection system antitoxin AbiGi family protein [Ignavibacteriaceae bacterium]